MGCMENLGTRVGWAFVGVKWDQRHLASLDSLQSRVTGQQLICFDLNKVVYVT